MDRFWSKVDKTGNCWLWKARLTEHGYGQFRFNNKTSRAHRVAYRLTKGDIPEGLHVLHRCDNRACVNPEHLFLGTHLDNMEDMKSKGKSNAYYPRRFNEEQVRDIRDMYDSGISATSLGKIFGVTGACISCIVRRKTYRWVEDVKERIN